MKLNLGRYAKFVTAVIGQAIAFASLYWGGTADAKYVSIAVAVASALGVYAVPNKPAAAAEAVAQAVNAFTAAPGEPPSNVKVVP